VYMSLVDVISSGICVYVYMCICVYVISRLVMITYIAHIVI